MVDIGNTGKAMIIFGKVSAVNGKNVWLAGGHSDTGRSVPKLTLGKAQMEGTKDIGLPGGMNLADLLGKSISVNAVERDYEFRSTNKKTEGQVIRGTSYYIGNILTIK